MYDSSVHQIKGFQNTDDLLIYFGNQYYEMIFK